MSRPARILVTGGAGFVGSTLVERLLAEGREVVALDSFDAFYPESLKRDNLAGALRSPRFRLEQGDVRDPAALARALAGGADAVVHLAALVGVRPSFARAADYVDVNVRGTAVVAEAMRSAGVGRLVYASSSSVYGERGCAGGPFRETDAADRPASPYAATKRAGELLLRALHDGEGLSVTCARIFSAYGPRQRPDLAIRKFAERMRAGRPLPIYGDGSASRDFTYVDDLVDALVRAVDHDLGFAILNLGAGRAVRLLDVVAELERALGVPALLERRPAQPGDVSRTWADASAAMGALGWSAKTSLEEGVARFAAWLAEPAS
jgi:UDP-glucuronate 4-epimerase